ncbi:MAG: HAMP domain-containing histidine kinase [Acidobacteria bacterium]|nr:HAMP domain-containing histidine kinase [Acidobacteriota bacterium]
MRIRKPSALTVLTSALLVLLPALAVLQYRWVGQVSDAERERMERNLRVAASQFREAFEIEIVRAVNGLRANVTTVNEDAWNRFADRYATWSATAVHPGIVEAVFLVDADGDAVRLRRWRQEPQSFDPVPWPAALLPWRPLFDQALAAFNTRQPFGRMPFPEDDSLIVAPLLNTGSRLPGPPQAGGGVFGFTVVQLDLRHVRDEVLPALMERHFANTSGDRYRVAVVNASNPSEVVYLSDPAAPITLGQADDVVPLYAAFRDPLAFLRGPGGRGGRGDLRRRDFDGSDEAVVRVRIDRDGARWALLVQHQSGSLEAAVANVRRRNLGISFGVLILLTGSIGVLAATSRRAQRLAHQQMEFVAGVSHELRTPVAVIRTAAENLSQGLVSGERVKRYGQMIETESRRLGEMVERVLQYAGLASGLGVGARAPIAPSELIESAIAAATSIVGSVNVQRAIDADLPLVLGDAPALRSAVQNLIANAVKYGGSDRWVGIRAERAVRGTRNEVRITIEDHGPGIPSDELPHIFEPFYRGAGAISRQVHGNGLGLALVQQIVAAHGGRVAVATRPGAGSSFTIVLPAADPDAPAVVAAEPAHAASGGAPS